MKFIGARILSFFLILMVFASVRAAVMVDNTTNQTGGFFGPIGNDANTHDFLIGQEFTFPPGPNPYQLNEISLLLYSSNGVGNVSVSLWNVDENNNPSNEIAGLTSELVTNTQLVNFFPATNITLPPGMYYVVASPGSPAGSGLVRWGYAANADWNGPGEFNYYADTYFGHWTNFSVATFPQEMDVQATVVTANFSGFQRHGNATMLAWPSGLTGFVADSTTNLAAPAWQQITNNPVPAGGTNVLTNSWSGPVEFFRLRQDCVVNNLGEPNTSYFGPIGSQNNGNGFEIGQEFTLPSGTNNLTGVTLDLNPALGSANITASVWSVNSANNPGSQIATIGTQTVGVAGNITFKPATPIKLPAGTYYIVVAPATASDNGKIGWFWTNSTGWIGFGTLGSSANTGYGSWQNYSIDSGPYQMSVQVTPVP
jgi:hypothetical protein